MKKLNNKDDGLKGCSKIRKGEGKARSGKKHGNKRKRMWITI